MKDITSTITKPLAVLGENGKGYTKEANFISWNGNAAKLDIREWHPNHERCGKGITLTEEEGRNLYAALKAIYEKEADAPILRREVMTMENMKTGFVERIGGTIFVVNAMPAENAKHTQEELVKALIAKEAMALQEADVA